MAYNHYHNKYYNKQIKPKQYKSPVVMWSSELVRNEEGEESYQKNAKSLLKISLGMAIEIEIFDTFNEKIIYNQFFFAEKTYIENSNKVMRSDASNVCELTEAILERAFLSIKDNNYRNKIIQGDNMQSQFTSAIFQLDTDKPEEVEKQSAAVLKELPQVDSF